MTKTEQRENLFGEAQVIGQHRAPDESRPQASYALLNQRE
jgi:hypothetical protein